VEKSPLNKFNFFQGEKNQQMDWKIITFLTFPPSMVDNSIVVSVVRSNLVGLVVVVVGSWAWSNPKMVEISLVFFLERCPNFKVLYS